MHQLVGLAVRDQRDAELFGALESRLSSAAAGTIRRFPFISLPLLPHISRMTDSAMRFSSLSLPFRPSAFPALARGAWFALGMLILAALGLAIDPRVITGAPAWLKPFKFALSMLLYVGTLAFMVRELPRTRALRLALRATSVLLTLEVVAIFVQAARGTSSHFNIDTPLDTAIFSSMGVGIAVVWLSSAVILWLHLRTPGGDRAMALAFRLGLTLNILGAGVGWTMTRPFPGQIEAISRGVHPFVAGAHTVGAADGGAGLPITRWSTDHGDLRIAHFVGMHALQLLPLLLLGIRLVRQAADDDFERAALIVATAAYLAAFVALLLQALNGHPLVPLSGS